MNRILSKRFLRELREKPFRYIALGLLVAAGMALVVSLAAAADTVIIGSEKKAQENKLEDGEFTVFVPLTESQEKNLSDTGISLEKMFSIDLKEKNGSTVRVMKNRSHINRIEVQKGKIAEKTGEVLLEQRYCEENKIKPGDVVEIGGQQLTVTGTGSVPDYDTPIANMSDSAPESKDFGIAFVTEDQYESFCKLTDKNPENLCYAYRLNDKMTDEELKDKIKKIDFDYNSYNDVYFKEMLADTVGKRDELLKGLNELNSGSQELKQAVSGINNDKSGVVDSINQLAEGISVIHSDAVKVINDYIKVDVENLTSFVKKEDNPRILSAANDMVMYKQTALIAGIFIMILFTYVISVFVIHQVNKESSIIGALYAMGAKKKQLIFHYITLPVFVTFISSIIGCALGFSKPCINYQMMDSYQYYSFPECETVYSPILMVYGILMPPVICAVVNSLVINKSLSRTALSLIKNEQNMESGRQLKLPKHISFMRGFQLRQIMRESRTGSAVIFGMIIALVIFMMGMDCYVMCNHIKQESKDCVNYEYIYTLKYPQKNPPKEADACITKSLSKSAFGYSSDITLYGIDKNNKFFDAKPEKGKGKIVIGKSVAQKYSLKKGDKLILTDKEEDVDYVFTVTEISDYSVGLPVFMDITSMRELFGEDEDYYNTLISDKKLDIEQGRIYSVTEKKDIERASTVFADIMSQTIIMLMATSFLIFIAVMYLMMNVMTDRAAFGISLMKTFGFNNREVGTMYLNGNAITIIVGAMIGIPVSKLIVDLIFPVMVANTSTGIDLRFTPLQYVEIFVGIMVIYFLINLLLTRKLKKINPSEVLKNRE